uniref:Putative Subtilisin n=1 Tax=Candidatus Nitrotoga fabula TaxID=2182327 RepID=A0A2X0QT27_9PROT|nr:putative Subtilisin [Candidatus Nitrotoga fabula]
MNASDTNYGRQAGILLLARVIFLAFALAACHAYSQVPGNEKGEAALRLLEKMQTGTSQDFIVVFDESAIQEDVQAMQSNMRLTSQDASVLKQKAVLYAQKKQEVHASFASHESAVLKDYSQLPLSFVRVYSRKALDKLLMHPGVTGVYENTVMKMLLAESLPLIKQPLVVSAGNQGAGTAVAVLDSGVDYTHPALGSCAVPGGPASCKVVYAKDFNPGGSSDHGTHVAGIVTGVAPGAKIVDLKVFGEDGTAPSSIVLEAINWAIVNRHTYNIVALNLSLGSGMYSSPQTGGIYFPAVQNARSAGISVVAAAGNEGYISSLINPAATDGVISVGAVYDSAMGMKSWSSCSDSTTAADKVTCFSNSALFLTLLAPGAMIDAAGKSMGGTSQAAPHVAGAIAVLRAAFPGEALDQIETRLKNGVQVTDARNSVTKPRLDLQMAVGTTTACSYFVSETGKSFGSGSATGNITVTAANGCTWSAMSNAPNWLTVTLGSSGKGNGVVSYALTENHSAFPRTGVLFVAGNTYTVTQAGVEAAWANLVGNPGFESGHALWIEQSSMEYPIVSQFLVPAPSNAWYAWLCGYNNCEDSLYQDVMIPQDASGAVLKHDYWIETEETTGLDFYDFMEVRVYSPPAATTYKTCASLTNLNATTDWVQSGECSLDAYKGKTVRVKFFATNDGLYPTSFYIDNVSLMINRPSSPGATAEVVEFYNTNLDHYFITADPNEAAGIDNGSAGPGWIRTGHRFKSGGSSPVCRFYGSMSPGPNSHFYTVDMRECEALKQLQASTPDTQKRWNFESMDFYTTPATSGTCPGGMAPVYRAYNNGFTQGIDSNHRIVSDPAAIQQVVSRGWISEGVVMCAPL